MSLPVRPDKTTAGIVVDPQTLERVVPSSRRTDGTIPDLEGVCFVTRKELKIRPGFTPQEDIGRFRSARQQDSDLTRNIVPGSAGRQGNKKDPYAREGEGDNGNPFKQSEPTPAEAAANAAAKSKAQVKNEKRREKKRIGGGGPVGMHDDLKWDEDEVDARGPAGGAGGGGGADDGKEMKEAFERMDRLRLDEREGDGDGDGGASLDPLGTGHSAPGGGAPEESVSAAVISDAHAEPENDASTGTLLSSTASAPASRNGSPVDPIRSPPPASDMPETAGQLVSSEKTEREWKAARPPRQQAGQRGGGGGNGAPGRGGGGRGGQRGSNRQRPPQAQPAAPAPAPEPRVRKEVRVRQGTAGDSGSLAARVRGLLVANQEPRSPRKTAGTAERAERPEGAAASS